MIHLPLFLEKKLKELFPLAQDRYDFVAQLVEAALEDMDRSQYDKQAAQEGVTVGGTLHMFTDGGSRGNPGQAAVGIVIEDPAQGVVLQEVGDTIGSETNNVAEYRALIEGLKLAKQYFPNVLVCHLDSELVVKQLSGEYRVKMPSLQEYFDEIQELKLEFPALEFKHIPRADNYRADALVNQALDAAGY